jgi:hypothetical protein
MTARRAAQATPATPLRICLSRWCCSTGCTQASEWLEASGYEPSRVMMQHVFEPMGDRGGNFRQQLQTEGFDARVWELYLYAAFSEAGYTIDTEQAVPDFSSRGMTWNGRSRRHVRSEARRSEIACDGAR